MSSTPSKTLLLSSILLAGSFAFAAPPQLSGRVGGGGSVTGSRQGDLRHRGGVGMDRGGTGRGGNPGGNTGGNTGGGRGGTTPVGGASRRATPRVCPFAASAAPTAATPRATPVAPAPVSLSGVNAAVTESGTAIGIDSIDASSWDYWWDYNQTQYLGLEALLPRLYPETFAAEGTTPDLSGRRAGMNHDMVYGKVVPELLRILERGADAQLERSALIALARVGEPPRIEGREPLTAFTPLIVRYLASGNTAVAEAAVLALGVLGEPDAVVHLRDLALGEDAGRELCGDQVSSRMRSLAVYGLGLAAAEQKQPELSRFVAHHVTQMLGSASERRPDFETACVTALGLVPVSFAGEEADDAQLPPGELLIDALLPVLSDRKRDDTVRAHVPTAIARLMPGAPDALKRRVAAVFLDCIGPRAKQDDLLCQSVVMALGKLGDSDLDAVDQEIRTVLEAATRKGDRQARSFAAIALAQVAARPGSGSGDKLASARGTAEYLTSQLSRGKSRFKPWVGLALGVLGNGLRAEGRWLDDSAANALLHRTGETRTPEDAAAYSLGSGLLGDARARSHVERNLDSIHDPSTQGRIALALGLMGDSSALAALDHVMESAMHLPLLMEQAALARGMLGDERLISELISRLDDCDCTTTTYGVTRALAWTADYRAVAPLLAIVADQDRTSISRSFALDALGWIADEERLPRGAVIAVGLNYAAAPPTLVDPSGTGLLNVL